MGDLPTVLMAYQHISELREPRLQRVCLRRVYCIRTMADIDILVPRVRAMSMHG
jgi:hypothetical protein